MNLNKNSIGDLVTLGQFRVMVVHGKTCGLGVEPDGTCPHQQGTHLIQDRNNHHRGEGRQDLELTQATLHSGSLTI